MQKYCDAAKVAHSVETDSLLEPQVTVRGTALSDVLPLCFSMRIFIGYEEKDFMRDKSLAYRLHVNPNFINPQLASLDRT